MTSTTNDDPQTNPAERRWGRFATTRHATGDEGLTLVELLVTMTIAVIVGVIGIGIYHNMTRSNAEYQQRVDLNTNLQDANVTINRDVDDAISIRTASDQELELAVIRDGVCNLRHYLADATAGTLTVTTTFFEQEACKGPSSDRVQQLVPERYTSERTFVMWGESPTIPIPSPLAQDALARVMAVQWFLAGEPYADRDAPDIELMSSTVFNGTGEREGDGTPQVQAGQPVLTLTTAVPGKDSPALAWTDPTPALTVGWVVRRATQPEGTPGSAFTTVAELPAATTSWTDTGLTSGAHARYAVIAKLTDGAHGPSSNAIDTGLRPATPTGVTATGQPTSINITWTAVSGATGYDIYRDGELRGRVATCPMRDAVCTAPVATTWTDGPGENGWVGGGYGHSHTYTVTATNRWEQVLTAGSPSGRVVYGAAVTTAYVGGTRLASAASGAFTAPAAPGLAATPRTDFTTLVARSFAPWQGGGPASLAGQHRDRTLEVQVATLTGPWTPLWTWSGSTPNGVHPGTPGSTQQFQARACNQVGCSPWSATASSLQRPPAPTSCSTAGVTTQAAQVTVNPPAMESTATGFQVLGGVGDAAGTGVSTSTVFSVSRLQDATSHTFTAKTRNASPANGGWSDGVTCTAVTADLVAHAPSVTITGGGVAPQTIRVTATGGSSSGAPWGASYGHLVSFGGAATWGSTISWTIGTEQTVRGQARGYTSDGYNEDYSGWVYTQYVSVTVPYPSPWGSSAPGCPSPMVYISPTSASTFQVRRASTSICNLRWVVTEYGEDGINRFEGDVTDTGSYTLGSGATAYTRTGGSGQLPMGPLYWP